MPMLVLVVDDSMLIRHTVCRFFEERGFAVQSATNGVDALTAISKAHPHLIITDLEMPEMNGLEVILELTCAFLDVKVITMSGRAADELRKAKPLGGQQTFPAPLDLHALLHAVQFELQHSPSNGVR